MHYFARNEPPIFPYTSLESTVSTGQEQTLRKNMSDFVLLFREQEENTVIIVPEGKYSGNPLLFTFLSKL